MATATKTTSAAVSDQVADLAREILAASTVRERGQRLREQLEAEIAALDAEVAAAQKAYAEWNRPAARLYAALTARSNHTLNETTRTKTYTKSPLTPVDKAYRAAYAKKERLLRDAVSGRGEVEVTSAMVKKAERGVMEIGSLRERTWEDPQELLDALAPLVQEYVL